MSKQDERSVIDLEVEVVGTPEEVWSAIATGAGITAWLQPTDVQEHVGGRFAFDLGGGMNDSGTVTVWGPPRRFASGGGRWLTSEGRAAFLATEWTIRAGSGGTCLVRMVMSGFGSGEDWDDEVDQLTEGMRAALELLRSYLTNASAGRDR